MGYAIKCYFTAETAKPIYNIWNSLAEKEIATFLKDSGSKPGITLSVWDNANEEELVSTLEVFVNSIKKIPKISSFGVAVFPTHPSQVILGITTTAELVSFHQNFHNLFPDLSATCSKYYQPGLWVAHSTLAIRCAPSSVLKIMEACLEYDTIINANIGSIGLLETGTARQIAEIEFNTK